MTHPPPRVAFSTLAVPDATLASALSLGRRWEKRWHPEIEPPEVALPQDRRVLAEWMELRP